MAPIKQLQSKITLTLQGKDNGKFLILCLNLDKGLTESTKICMAFLGVWQNFLKSLRLGVLGSNISPHRPLLRYLCKYNLDLYPCQYLKTKDYTT